MRLFILAFTVLLAVSSCFGQETSFEKTFASNKKKLKVVHFALGEDATSGFDYLVYKNKSEIVKVRVIWSSSYKDPRVEDYYFENGNPALFVKFAARKNQYRRLTKGVTLPLVEEERLVFEGSKVKTWIEKKRVIPSSHPKWVEKETEILASFKDQVETYESHVRGEL